MLAILLAVALQEVPEGRVTTGPERSSAVRLEISGRLDVHYLSRDGALNEAGSVLNGGPPGGQATTNAWAGRMSLRADATVKDSVTGVLELENRSFEDGINEPFSSDPRTDTVLIRQGYIGVPDFLLRGLNLRVGIQNLRLQNRPHDEPFFMDLNESESFFAGFSAAGARVGNTVDRDIREATGLRVQWTPNDFMTVQGAALVYGEGGATSSDESVYLLAVNSLLGEHWSAWLLATDVSGGDPDLGQVVTVGAGVDGYFLEDRRVEVFAEVYGQAGTLTTSPRSVRKQAYAFNAGGRYRTGCGCAWFEGAFSERTGDRRAGDGTDQAFQSYENENRFLILQSSEFGLDVDTNVRLIRAAVGTGPMPLVDGRPLRLQLDLGRFSAMQQLPGSGSTRQWGIETDLTATWTYNESLVLKVQAAALWNSGLLETLTVGGEDRAFIVVAGADLRF